jgi:hypothetical protein
MAERMGNDQFFQLLEQVGRDLAHGDRSSLLWARGGPGPPVA